MADVLAIVDASGLGAAQKARAGAIYSRLAAAEAKVHGTTVERVHFHEVGQIDAILDVAAACLALDQLGIEQVYSSAYPLGTGSISMHHGRYPNPPPATAELMRDAPTISTNVRGEMVTTTAAAIFATLVERVGERPSMTFDRIGYGAGTSDFSIPNVLRVAIGETQAPVAGERPADGDGLEHDRVVVLEANVDDMSPQHFELAFERVFAAGALDAWCVPIAMKKSRPGLLFGVIAKPEDADRCALAILRETTTLGVRRREQERDVLARRIDRRETPLGTVRVKVVRVAGHERSSLEYDDVARIARESGRPVAEVARALEGYLSPG